MSLIYLRRWDDVVDFITVSSPFQMCVALWLRGLSGGRERERIFTHWTASLVMWLCLGSDEWVGYTVLRAALKALLYFLNCFSPVPLRVVFHRVAIPLTRMRKICAEELQPTCNLSKKTFGFLCQWNLAAVTAAKSRENYWNIPYLVVYARYWTRADYVYYFAFSYHNNPVS